MPHTFKIPPKLKEILDENYSLDGFVKSSISEFAPWLKENNVKFFSEYTDHNLEHVENVLKTAAGLIREDCRGIVSAGDVAVLVLASFLHDCAMHLSEDGFATLIASDNLIDGFGDKPWSKLWEDFIAESRRFSGRKLMAMFGDADAIKPPPTDPKALDGHKMTGKDLLLIGEFLRSHHHRLAHEIAVYGVPGPDGHRLKLPEKEETKHIVDLAGVVARSHGLPIRACHDYLEDKYSDAGDFKRVHPVFLMALLRLADILQLQSTRAPRQIQKVRSLRSPVSQGEWEMHQAIGYINRTKYPETIFIHAEPPNARTYLRIKDMLAQVQHELDSSWTVISEAYSPVESLQKLGLTIRRVRSNLDDVEVFAKKVDYIPCRAAFEVADTDLLKLLIGPLYGEKPEIGIRELMQNAVDAVRERRAYQEKHPESKNAQFTDQEAEVVISIDEEEDGCWVTVSDQGIGMTLDSVRNYFLKAGASLRRSEIWRKEFEDEEGKSRVLRSGRFGVGVLAAYLLGTEIEVSTRHINEPEKNGISFSAELDAEAIELFNMMRPVGTTIRIHINHEVRDRLRKNPIEWDWYCLTNPKVLIMTDHGSKKLHQRHHLPLINEKLPTDWRRISHPHYQDIQWTSSGAPGLICNGIKITSGENWLLEMDYLRIRCPNISVFDYDANLPLNLQRTGLTQDQYPFHDELLRDVINDFIASVLVNAPVFPLETTSLVKWCSRYNYVSFINPYHRHHYKSRRELLPWFFTKQGLSITFDEWQINQVISKKALVLPLYDFSDSMRIPPRHIADIYRDWSNTFFYSISRLAISKIRVAERIKKSLDISFMTSHTARVNNSISGIRSLISRHALALIEEVSKFEQKSSTIDKLRPQITEEWQNDNWVLLRKGDCPEPGFDFEKFASENDGKNIDEWPCVLGEWYFKDKKPEIKELSPLAKVWKDVVGQAIIPFDLEERRKLKAYEILKPYIEAHEEMKKQNAEG